MNHGSSPEAGTPSNRGTLTRRGLLTASAVLGVSILRADTRRAPRGPMNYENQFPEFFEPGSAFNPNSEPLLNQDILNTQRDYFLNNREYLREAWRSKTVIDLGDTAFVASIVRGESDSAVVSAAEYGNPLNRLGVVRHLGVRAVVDPQATAIYLPANIRGQNNLNYSQDEREQLDRGDHSPFTRRVEAALGYVGVRGPIHAYGLSQSADFVPACAIHTDHDVRDMALTETPFLEDQYAVDSMLRVALSGGQLEEYYQMSRQGILDEAFTNDGTFSFNDFLLGALFDPDNQAMLTYMNERNIAKDIVQFRKDKPDAGLVMLSGARSQVSPLAQNRAIAKALQGTRSEFHEAGNANHDMTNAYAVVAAASLRAYELAA